MNGTRLTVFLRKDLYVVSCLTPYSSVFASLSCFEYGARRAHWAAKELYVTWDSIFGLLREVYIPMYVCKQGLYQPDGNKIISQ